MHCCSYTKPSVAQYRRYDLYMAPTPIDALNSGSSLAHVLQRLFLGKTFYAPGARSDLKVLGVFFTLHFCLWCFASIIGVYRFRRHWNWLPWRSMLLPGIWR